MATYYRNGSSEIHSYTNSFSETFPQESTNNVSVSKEIQVLSSFGGSSSQIVQNQDSSSWRDQEEDNNDKNCFPVMMRLGLSPQTETSIGNHNNEYAATQVVSGFTRTIHNSKYLKAAQELLDEAVNVKKALKQFHQPEGDNIDKEKEKNLHMNIAVIPQAERQELQSKLSKLLSILDEVDRRYKQYYHQMQIVVSSFDVIAGCGAAKQYTSLALQTISSHFRCLRDAISKQILVIRNSLGSDEHDGLDGRGGGISRLRNVDQQVRQQTALQRLGVLQPHAWRAQRGLPDSSVLILRAWLFEHFLHPYPKDSDKIMLARQTGLSRGQVSNWFINARVRLWKPMVEEMYKKEFTDALEENGPSLSSENTPEITEIQEQQQTESNPKTGVASSSSMGQSTVACGNDRFMTRNGSGGMSLTLGIHDSDDLGNVPMSSVIDNYENVVAGSNRQYRLGSSQLLHDFVA